MANSTVGNLSVQVAPLLSTDIVPISRDGTNLNKTTLANIKTFTDNLNFGTVVVSGQSNVVASTNSSPLTLVAGSNITITNNVATSSVTINSTANAGVPLKSYMGQVATRCGFSTTAKYGGYLQAQARTIHQATDNLTAPRVIFSTSTNGQSNLDVNANIECSIEYPLNSGNYHRRTFSGINIGVITPTAFLVSDASVPLNAGITIPKGAFFAVRNMLSSASTTGLQGTSAQFTNVGAPYYEGAIWTTAINQTNLVVTTGTGGVSGNNDGYNTANPSFRPVAIIDSTTQASVFIAGDSIAFGQADVSDGLNRQGIIERALGNVGTINAAISGESIGTIISTPSTYVNRAQMIQYCSHIIVEYGANDININAATGAVLMGNVNSFRTTYGVGKYMLACTLLPLTTSTDGFATLVNQTVGAGDARRQDYNKLVRTTGLLGYVGMIDLEFWALDSYAVPKWKIAINGTAFTGDGTHPSNMGYNYIGSNVKINLF